MRGYSYFLALLVIFSGSHTQAQSIRLIPNPDAIGVTPRTTIGYKNQLYINYNTQLALCDTTHITLIPNPAGSIGYIDFPIVANDKLCMVHSVADNSYFLSHAVVAAYDGTKTTIYPNPDGGQGEDIQNPAPVVYNNKLYFQYDNSNGGSCLGQFDGSKVTIASQTEYDGSPLLFNGDLYMTCTDGTANRRLGQYNGTKLTLIPNPDGALGSYGGYPVAYNSSLYFQYGAYVGLTPTGYLSRLDGQTITKIPNIPGGNYGSSPAVFNGNLNFFYSNKSGITQLGQYNGTDLSTIAGPASGAYLTNISPFVYNNKLYCWYQQPGYIYQLAQYDGGSLTLIPNPDGGNGGGGVPIIYNNDLYFSYANKSGGTQLARFDGNTISLIANPDGGIYPPYNYSGQPCVVNGILYLQYVNWSGVTQMAYLAGPPAPGSANFSVNNPNPSMVLPSGLVDADLSHINYADTAIGAVTDGVTKLLLLLHATSSCTVTLPNAGDGYLSTLQDQGTLSSSVTVTPDASGLMAVVYIPPNGPGTLQPASSRTAAITYTNSAAPGNVQNATIQLFPPPVVLVHGMWSNPDVWNTGGFVATLQKAGIANVYAANYQKYSSNTFDPQDDQSKPAIAAVAQTVRNALQDMRRKKIAAAQVDMVCHSLGGLVTRSWSQSTTAFRQQDNYFKGYIHKFITLGTPHRGSPLGPVLWNAVNNTLYLPGPISVGVFMLIMNMPIGTVHRDFDKNSAALANLNATLPFRTYSITGNYLSDPSTKAERGGADAFGALLKAATHKTFDQIFTQSPCMIVPNTDLIVEVNSQTGGIVQTANFPGVAHSTLPTTETNATAVQSTVVGLLLSVDTTFFSLGFPAPSAIPIGCKDGPAGFSTHPIIQGATPTPAAIRPSTIHGSIKLVSPLRGASYAQNSGATITLQYSTKDVAPASAVFLVQATGEFAPVDSLTDTAGFVLPANLPVGRIQIAAMVQDTSGLVYADTSSIVITPVGTLDSLSVEPGSIRLDSAIRESDCYVHGYFATGDTLNNQDLSSPATGTRYQAGTSGVFNVSAGGTVTAVKPGIDTLLVTNNGITVHVPVTVDSNYAGSSPYPNVIDFSQLPDVASTDTLISLPASASSGDTIHYTLISGPATLSSGALVITGPGTITLTAADAGNAYFAPASTVTQSFCAGSPLQPVITSNMGILVSSDSTGNQWFQDSVAISGATGVTYRPSGSANYTVQATVGSCTSPLSAPYHFVATDSVNIDSLITVYPNPVTGSLTIDNGGPNLVQAQLYDMLGRLVLTVQSINGRYIVDMRGLTSGVYVLIIRDNSTKEVSRKKLLKL